MPGNPDHLQPGNTGGGRKPAPRKIQLDQLWLHPEAVASTLGTSAARVREWIDGNQLRSGFAWRGIPYVAAADLERALTSGGLPGAEPGNGLQAAAASAGTSHPRRADIGPPAAVGPGETAPPNPGDIFPRPDFEWVISPAAPRSYDPRDSKGLPELPHNWRECLEAVPTFGPRLVRWVELVWLEGRPVKEAIAEPGMPTEGTWRADKKRILQRLGLT
jgi:hypothetical protein